MILKTKKQDPTKSYSEVCWAGSVLGLWPPGSPFSKPLVSKPAKARRHLAPPRLRSGRTRAILTRAATAARPTQRSVPARLPFRGRARGGAGAAGASPRGHGGAVAAAATSGECPAAGRAGPGPAFLLRPLPPPPEPPRRERAVPAAMEARYNLKSPGRRRPRFYELPGPLRASGGLGGRGRGGRRAGGRGGGDGFPAPGRWRRSGGGRPVSVRFRSAMALKPSSEL